MPPKFFVTHSWKDIDFTKRLCDDLRANDLEGFLDAYSIKPGDMVSAEISHGLEACDIYVPILSHAALKSVWCEEEINAAITLGKLPGRNGRPRIIPVLVEECQDEMSIFLRSRLYINFANRYNDALGELLKAFGVQTAPPNPIEVVPPKQMRAHQSRVAVPPQPQEVVPPVSAINALSSTRTNPKDGKEMILIPAGEFMMGSNEVSYNEKPPHQVYLDAFYISRYLVTNAEYKKFVEATRRDVPFVKEDWAKPYNWDKETRDYPKDKANHPVVLVSWNDAIEYCKWAEARLPTEAEWEKAASWDDAKKEKRVYPWGKDFDASNCNTSESKIDDTTPVGRYSPQGDSAYGVADMAGNVWEWCADWYDMNYYKNSPKQNPLGPDSGQYRILRGGSWFISAGNTRCAFRHRGGLGLWYDFRGFRCARSFSS